jgi:hypothetical protein
MRLLVSSANAVARTFRNFVFTPHVLNLVGQVDVLVCVIGYVSQPEVIAHPLLLFGIEFLVEENSVMAVSVLIVIAIADGDLLHPICQYYFHTSYMVYIVSKSMQAHVSPALASLNQRMLSHLSTDSSSGVALANSMSRACGRID